MFQNTTVLIPAYNEENRIHKVLEIVTKLPFKRIIVINDGSLDNTYHEAIKFPIEVLTHKTNLGKGAALQNGIDFVQHSPYWVFLDADLINLSTSHIEKLLSPLEEDSETAMAVGMFTEGGKLHVDLAQRFFGILNGQRSFSQSFIESLPSITWARFGVEIFLSKYADHQGVKVHYPVLEGLTHWTKEEKFGLVKGFSYRLQMYRECLSSLKNWHHYI
ncbi:glycosyltransferase family 2 protein [Natranaerobius thermophilus]|uniref:Glycosyl transferase family 2 n=1 Tax=Natranaerobius thermophilus (strain ATCC BAA-1301 / DSM 18059 / JW/NM-WN-LF) TaxID=457570 RepID=B2A4X4_NATTJ|nr:glycosyltransferase family 2 protein [Natranaerobius thermophilus]ACB83896.1 glycosyl transferase family 2 [Natranaerobius thermophilus JW/NM-WN-LF]